MLRILLSVLLVVHGIAHLVGFLVPWRLVEMPEMPYSTTILAGQVDLGDTGIRVYGILWLLGGVAFLLAAWGGWTRHRWWAELVVGAALLSLILSVLGWPDSRIGVWVNLALLAGLFVWRPFEWL